MTEVNEDRSEPPPGYGVDQVGSDFWRPELTGSDWLPTREQAVAACWAHRDAVLATDKRIERALAILKMHPYVGGAVMDAIAALTGER